MNASYKNFGSFLSEVRAAKQPLCMVIFGPPGSGKGTNARKLTGALGLLHVETGAMIREEIKEGSPLGKKVESFVQKGQLVPDGVIYQLLEKRLSTGSLKKGVIFDGMPRTIAQTKELDSILARHGLKVNLVVSLNVPDKVVIQRMRKRAELEKRPDDLREGVIETRVAIYHRESDPILSHYKAKGFLVRVNSAVSPRAAYRRVRRRVRLSGLRRTAKAVGQVAKKRMSAFRRRK